MRPQLAAARVSVADLHEEVLWALGKRFSIAGHVHGRRHNGVLIWLSAESPAELVCAEAQRLSGAALIELFELSHRTDTRLWLVATGPTRLIAPKDIARAPVSRLLGILDKTAQPAESDPSQLDLAPAHPTWRDALPGVQDPGLGRAYCAAYATALARCAQHLDCGDHRPGPSAALVATCLSRAESAPEAEVVLRACQAAIAAHRMWLVWEPAALPGAADCLPSHLSRAAADALRQYVEPERIGPLLCHLATEASPARLAELSSSDVSADGRWLRVGGDRLRLPDYAVPLLAAVRRTARLARGGGRGALLVDGDAQPLSARRIRVAIARLAEDSQIPAVPGSDDEPWGRVWMDSRDLAFTCRPSV